MLFLGTIRSTYHLEPNLVSGLSGFKAHQCDVPMGVTIFCGFNTMSLCALMKKI